MKTMVVWYPGCDMSVSDVAAGLQSGLERQGVQVVPFKLSAHLDAAGAGLHHLHQAREKAEGRKLTPPTVADIYYAANTGVLERALRYDAETVIMVSGLYQHPDYAVMLHRAGRRVVLVCTESPYSVDQELRMLAHRDPKDGRLAYDHVFVNERTMVARYAGLHPSVSYLPAGYHPDVHQPGAGELDGDAPAHDAVFVGTGFIERQLLLEQMDWHGVNFGLYGVWELLGDHSPLWPHLRNQGGFVPNALTAALYRRARVGLNLHRSSIDYTIDTRHVPGAESLNPRCYELAACGRFFITDWRAELDDVFGSALPTFRTPADAEALLRRALQEPAWREDVAADCARRVRRHSWEHRAATVLEHLSAAGVAA